MSARIKSPDWYRLQAVEIREKADAIGGPYGVRLRRIAEHWDKLAAQVAAMRQGKGPRRINNVVYLNHYRTPPSA
jgi:hypothetical protein